MKKFLLVLLAAFIIMQFFRIDMDNPEVKAEEDFITLNEPNEEIEGMLRNACYDCHSNETNYPWYAYVSPFSWWIGNHIEEGREELNFSKWGTYSDKRRDHKLEECIELIEEGEMPLNSYTWTHSDARLDDNQKEALIDFFNNRRE